MRWSGVVRLSRVVVVFFHENECLAVHRRETERYSNFITTLRAGCGLHPQHRSPPTTWTILQQDGPDHLGLWHHVPPEHQTALITSGCVCPPAGRARGRHGGDGRGWLGRGRLRRVQELVGMLQLQVRGRGRESKTPPFIAVLLPVRPKTDAFACGATEDC